MDLLVGDVDKHNDKDGYSKSFLGLWPTYINEDIIKLNDAIKNDYMTKKESYQIVIREVSKWEYMIIQLLLIGASTCSDQGDELFHDESSNFGRRDKKHW